VEEEAAAAEALVVEAEAGAVVEAVALAVEEEEEEEQEEEQAEAEAAEAEEEEGSPAQGRRADQLRCWAPVESRLSYLPWGREWVERAMRPRWRGPSRDSASAHRRARSSRSAA
jgi:hypothetical protein